MATAPSLQPLYLRQRCVDASVPPTQDDEEMLKLEIELAGRVFRTANGTLACSEESDPSVAVDARLIRRVIACALITHLTAKQRIIIVGHWLEGRDLTAVAADMGIKVAEASRLNKRATAKLMLVPELRQLWELL